MARIRLLRSSLLDNDSSILPLPLSSRTSHDRARPQIRIHTLATTAPRTSRTPGSRPQDLRSRSRLLDRSSPVRTFYPPKASLLRNPMSHGTSGTEPAPLTSSRTPHGTPSTRDSRVQPLHAPSSFTATSPTESSDEPSRLFGSSGRPLQRVPREAHRAHSPGPPAP